MVAQQSEPEQRGLNIGVGTGETQAIVIQLGRIADLLQELVNFYRMGNPVVKPQPFGESR